MWIIDWIDWAFQEYLFQLKEWLSNSDLFPALSEGSSGISGEVCAQQSGQKSQLLGD